MISLGCSTPLRIQRTHLLGLSMGWMIALEFALRHGHRLDRLVLTGTGAAPARSAVDPIEIWNWVKSNVPTADVFGGQPFVSPFSTAFLRNHQAVRDTADLLASKPYPMSSEAYQRQADAYRQFDALDRLPTITAPTLWSWASRISPDATLDRVRGRRSNSRCPVRGHPRGRVLTRRADRAPQRLQPARVGLPFLTTW